MKVKYNEKELMAVLKNACEQAALGIFNRAQRNLVEKIWKVETKKGLILTSISDTGYLLRSGDIYEIENGWTIFYDCPYADKVEFGSPPGTIVDVNALEKWVKRKLGIKKNSKSIAYAIKNKIYKEGIEPRPFLRNAIEEGKYKWKMQLIK